MIKINKENFLDYIFGSVSFACGGGAFSFENQIKKYEEFLKNGEINFFELEEFEEEEFLISAYGIGKPKGNETAYKKLIKKSFEEFEKAVGQKISGVIPGEIGGEIPAIDFAKELGLKLVNSDLVGGRAVPEVSMDAFGVREKSICPVVLALETGEVMVVKNASTEKVEEISRELCRISDGSIWLIGYLISVKEAKEILIQNTVSETLEFGIFRKNLGLEKAVEKIGGRKIGNFQIKKIEEKESKGFLLKNLIMEKEREEFELVICNEFLALKKGEELLVRAPDKILVFKNGKPLHSSEATLGDSLEIFVTESVSYWKEELARKMFDKFFLNS